MPMGIKNAPAIHQRHVRATLRPWLGKICHVYLDNIIIWSQSLAEHRRNVRTILTALKSNKLYCNPKKMSLFCTELHFLGHHISTNGIEVDKQKTDRITNWPIPASAKDVRSFLGLVRYLAIFLLKLANHTGVLDALTKKECDMVFPEWTTQHQNTFDEIKQLAISTKCLTTIDTSTMPDNKIFITTDTSDYGCGAILSFRPSCKLARPIAYKSRSFKGAELNYPVHKKELLAIVHALRKWRTDLLGFQFEVWTDHRTLEHFRKQCNLSWRQARWMEFMSQYNATIHYLPGKKNTVADALSRLPERTTHVMGAILNDKIILSRFDLEDTILEQICNGYSTDPYTKTLEAMAPGMLNIHFTNGYWFVDDRLFVPKVTHVREALFHIAHHGLHRSSPLGKQF